MASIEINNLQPAGADLFNDSESYLNDLKSQEWDVVSGGSMTWETTIIIILTPPIIDAITDAA